MRAYAGANRTGCFDETSVTVYSNQISGTNQIGPNLQELCVGEDPVMIGDLQTPTSNGTSNTFEWEIRPLVELGEKFLELIVHLILQLFRKIICLQKSIHK